MKHDDIISRLTLYEKCHLLSGKNFWNTVGIEEKGVPSVALSDGPHGIRKQYGKDSQMGIGPSYPATCFPTSATVANSWDTELCEKIGEALGEEAASQGVSVLLGPGLNIKRNPLCGRNFEYFSEDPYLAGKLAAGYVRGIQKNGISACIKHFAANNTELRRMASDSIVDERTLREIYLTAFEIAVKEAKPKSLMASYNQINGVYGNENEKLLNDILRGEWGFDGFVVSDWGACNDFVEGVRAGSDLEMPSTRGDSPDLLIKAVKDGRISEDIVDKRVDELLDVILSTAEAVKKYEGKDFDIDAHHSFAEKAAAESLVLLKNEEGILPLRAGTKVAVIGDFADNPRYQGAGSSLVNPTRLDSALGVIKDCPLELIGYEKGYERSAPANEQLISAAAELAKKAEVVLLYLGLDESGEAEGLDREHMRLSDAQLRLIDGIYSANKNIVVILAAGSPVEMPWLEKAKGLIHGCLCGQAGAGAILKAVCGIVNPSGKLSETYPLSYGDIPSSPYFPAKERGVEYREGLYVGYRYFDTVKKPVLFPFGYGLSYTSFLYSEPEFTADKAVFTLKNTGDMDGAEIAQLYVRAENSSVYRPNKELKGFKKVFLKAGESKRVAIPLDDKAFRYFNTVTGRFEKDGGEYTIMIGSSVSDIRLSGTVKVDGMNAPKSEEPEALPHYRSGDITAVPDEEFAALLGHPIPDTGWGGTIGMNDALCQLYYAKSLKARLAYRIMRGKLDKGLKKGDPDLHLVFIFNMPIRAMSKVSGGYISEKMCRSVVGIVNGHAIAFFKGIGGFISGYFRQRKLRKKMMKIK